MGENKGKGGTPYKGTFLPKEPVQNVQPPKTNIGPKTGGTKKSGR